MEHATLKKLVGSNQYVADEGYVITNYKEGDEQMIYSPGLIFAVGYEPEGFYTMLEADASALADKVNPKFEEPEMPIHEEMLHEEIEEASIEEAEEIK